MYNKLKIQNKVVVYTDTLGATIQNKCIHVKSEIHNTNKLLQLLFRYDTQTGIVWYQYFIINKFERNSLIGNINTSLSINLDKQI